MMMGVKHLLDVTGKTALVTGGSQGIGKAIALALAEHGARVIINYRSNDTAARETYKQVLAYGGDVCLWKYDLASPAIREDFSAFAADNALAVDILVLNASVQRRSSWTMLTADEVTVQMNINFRASLELIQICTPVMRQNKWGRILTLGSVQQNRPNPQMVAYAASKAAQLNMVKNLAPQLGSYGITINNLAPGVIKTIRNQTVLAEPGFEKEIKNKIPLGYIGEPEDLAVQALVLCSDAGRYITGADFLVDGGMSLHS